ncbi:sensor histidine kinase [Pedobacter duraquae]|uniref:sensor histidine kinase n=1 Tax=Pedobacter duraquae TaxID=425511 RepID=UPI0010616883|nr:histidine kinase [Pedobacter duraquae]
MNNNLHLSLYWKCQLIGWSVAALYWMYTGLIGQHFQLPLAALQFVTDVAFYVVLSHQYRNIVIRNGWQNLPLDETVKRIVPSILIMAVAYSVVTIFKIYFLRRLAMPDYRQDLLTFIEINGPTIFIAGIRLMSIWLLAYHLYHYAQREIRIAKENARLAIITQEAQLHNLSSQLNPHFLFNALNAIKSLIIEDADSARRGIDLLSELLRKSLDQHDLQLVSVAEEVELVTDYLELEKLRIEERLEKEFTINESCNTLMIPRFSIQTLVENAVKHGISTQQNGGCISVKINKNQGYLNILVQNPGILNLKRNNGIGLKNLRKRLSLHYGQRASFEIMEQIDQTVLATIKIPLT